MAIAEYIVVAGIQSDGGSNINRTWNGAATESQVNDRNSSDAKYFVVEAESVAEAITGVKQLYPTSITGKVVGVAKSSVTES